MNTKLLIGGIVGGLILFFWSFLSWSILPVHQANVKYTPAQDEILNLLSSKLTEDGSYHLPNVPPGTSPEDTQKMHEASGGKPWATISYHQSMNTSMSMNMIRGLITNIVVALFALWLVYKQNILSFRNNFTTCVVIGLLSYLSTWYATSIWFETNTMPELVDAIVGWGLVGIWYGLWAKNSAR